MGWFYLVLSGHGGLKLARFPGCSPPVPAEGGAFAVGEAGSRPREGDGQATPLGMRRGAVALSRQKVNHEEKKVAITKVRCTSTSPVDYYGFA